MQSIICPITALFFLPVSQSMIVRLLRFFDSFSCPALTRITVFILVGTVLYKNYSIPFGNISTFSTVLPAIMSSSRKRGNQQRNSEHPVPRGRPPKRRAKTSQNPNQRQNHLVLSNQVPSIDNNPHSRGNLQFFSADLLETLRTMI